MVRIEYYTNLSSHNLCTTFFGINSTNLFIPLCLNSKKSQVPKKILQFSFPPHVSTSIYSEGEKTRYVTKIAVPKKASVVQIPICKISICKIPEEPQKLHG
jgi:hypothetical protein